jgi:hypothetical protein
MSAHKRPLGCLRNSLPRRNRKKTITDPYATQNFNISSKNENCLKYEMLNHSLSTDTIEEENSNGFGIKLKVKNLSNKKG